MKTNLLLIAVFLCSSLLYSQVGINTETPSATLDVRSTPSELSKTDGITFPKLSGDELKAKDANYDTDQTGTIVYVTQGLAEIDRTPKTIKVSAPGPYYFDGEIWQAGVPQSPQFFYMPAVIFDTSATGSSLTRDLYTDYVNQFTGINPYYIAHGAAGSSMSYTGGLIASTNAPTSMQVFDSNEMYYYITYYDEEVFANLSIDENGVLTYDIIGNANDTSYMNIVFVIK